MSKCSSPSTTYIVSIPAVLFSQFLYVVIKIIISSRMSCSSVSHSPSPFTPLIFCMSSCIIVQQATCRAVCIIKGNNYTDHNYAGLPSIVFL